MANQVIKISPTDVDARLASQAACRIVTFLASHPHDDPVEMLSRSGDNDAFAMPRAVAVMLAKILEYLARGQGVRLMPDKAMLTTQQAADALDMSRRHLISLLDAETIKHEMVGTHRRIAVDDVLAYQQRNGQQPRQLPAGNC